MHTKAAIRLRKPLTVSNQQLQELNEDSSLNKNSSPSSSRNFNQILQRNVITTPKKITTSDSPLTLGCQADSLKPQTPRDGIFSNSMTPIPKASMQFFSKPIEKELSDQISRSISGSEMPKLELPVLPQIEQRTSEKGSELESKKPRQFYLSNSARAVSTNPAVLAKIIITKDNAPNLPSLKSIDENSQLSDFEHSILNTDKFKERRANFESETMHLSSYQDLISEFFLCASLCHQCIIEISHGDRSYEGPSPDEIAICKGSRKAGCEFIGTSSDGVSEVNLFGKTRKLNMIMVGSFYIRNSLLIQIERDTR
jgi:hypothetical protein